MGKITTAVANRIVLKAVKKVMSECAKKEIILNPVRIADSNNAKGEVSSIRYFLLDEKTCITISAYRINEPASEFRMYITDNLETGSGYIQTVDPSLSQLDEKVKQIVCNLKGNN